MLLEGQHHLQLIGIVGQLSFIALTGSKLDQGITVIVTKRELISEIINCFLLINLNVLLVDVVQVTGSGLGNIMKQAKLQHPPDISLAVELSQGVADHRRAKAVLGY